MTVTPAMRLYRGRVMHRRRAGQRYRFVYRVFSVLVDIDRLDEAAGDQRLFAHNRFNLVSVHDVDHGPKDGSPLRPWIDARLAEAGIHVKGGTVQLLAYPRVLGFVFNPLSLWFCHHRDGTLRAVLCEVRNTFGDWHGYLLHDTGRPMRSPVRGRATKCFHVSPFLPLTGGYRFSITRPSEHYRIAIAYLDGEHDPVPALVAVQWGERAPVTDATLVGCTLAMPLMTLKVVAAIHWQALRIWLRGGRFHSRPDPPSTEITR